MPLPLLADCLYPIVYTREPQPGLRLVCLRDPWLGQVAPSGASLRAWAPGSIGDGRGTRTSPSSCCALGRRRSVYLDGDQRLREGLRKLVTVEVAGSSTEAVVCEGAWRAGETAGGPRSSPTWCINPQYWITVSVWQMSSRDREGLQHRQAPADGTASVVRGSAGELLKRMTGKSGLLFEMRRRRPLSGDRWRARRQRLRRRRRRARRGGGGGGRGRRRQREPLPADFGVSSGEALPLHDGLWARVAGETSKALVGECAPKKRRSVGLTVISTPTARTAWFRAALWGGVSPFVLRLQSECRSRSSRRSQRWWRSCPAAWDRPPRAGPARAKTWTMNPQYWLTLRPPPTGPRSRA